MDTSPQRSLLGLPIFALWNKMETSHPTMKSLHLSHCKLPECCSSTNSSSNLLSNQDSEQILTMAAMILTGPTMKQLLLSVLLSVQVFDIEFDGFVGAARNE
jgi:hypothetical protein